MLTFIVAFAVAVAVAAALTPTVSWAAHRFGLVDKPDFGRKVHTIPVPRLGGIAVVVAFLTPVALLAFHENQVADVVFADKNLVLAFAVGALGILALGIYDDLKSADAKVKLVVQVSVAVMLWAAGFRIEALGGSVGHAIDIGLLSMPLTVVWIVGIVNAVNLIDGLDGLASGIALIASLALLGVSLVHGQVLLALMMSALAGALLGFLFFNFNPAKIFLGDSGSLFLGYVLAVVSLWTHHKQATATVVTALPLFVVAVPIIDTTLCIIRRTARGQNPFSPDREHLHHRLMAMGLSHKTAVLALYAVAVVFAGAGVVFATSDVAFATLAVAVAVCTGALLIVRVGLFGDPNNNARTLLATADTIASEVRDATSLDAAWRKVENTLPTIGFKQAELVVHTLHDGPMSQTAPPQTVLSWKVDDAVAANDDDDVLVLRLASSGGGRVGALSARFSTRLDPPQRAARRRALKSLHGALRDVSARAAAQGRVGDSGPVVTSTVSSVVALHDAE